MLCLYVVTTGEQRGQKARGVLQIQDTGEKKQGPAHLISPPGPWAALQGCTAIAFYTPLG